MGNQFRSCRTRSFALDRRHQIEFVSLRTCRDFPIVFFNFMQVIAGTCGKEEVGQLVHRQEEENVVMVCWGKGCVDRAAYQTATVRLYKPLEFLFANKVIQVNVCSASFFPCFF